MMTWDPDNGSYENTSLDCPEVSGEAQLYHLIFAHWLLNGVVQLALCIAGNQEKANIFATLKYFPGTLGNIAAIFLLTRPKIRSTFFNQLLVVLATWDLIYILTMALEAARLSCQRNFAKFRSARRRPL